MFSSVLLFAAVALSGSAHATHSSVELRAATLACNTSTPVSGWFTIGDSTTSTFTFAGWSNTYKLADAIQAAGSTANAGDNPYVIHNGGNSNFAFKICASTAMGYPADDTVANGGTPKFYGQIYVTIPVGITNPYYRCVTRHPVDPGLEFLTLEPCLKTDNTTLSTQYFQVTQTYGGYPGARWSIENIGHPKGTTGKIYWAPGTSNAPAWTVYPDGPTGYTPEFL